MSIIDRIQAELLDKELRTGRQAMQVVVGRDESTELFFLGFDLNGGLKCHGVHVICDTLAPNGITVITNKEDMR